MQNWDDLKLMLALNRYGTMSAAAEVLGLSTATVSRRLERCADDLGMTLFVRRGNNWEPTEASREMLEMAETVMDAFPQNVRKSDQCNTQVRSIRAAMPLDICMDALAPFMPGFLRQNEGLTFDAIHELKSLAFGEADICLSYEKPSEGRLVRFRVGTLKYRSFVHEDHAGSPKGWVQILDYERKPSPLVAEMTKKFGPPRFTTTSISCAINLLEDVHLALWLPTKLAARCEGLKSWQPELEERHFPVWAAYHESRKLDPDVQLALDFVKKCFDA